MYLISWKHNVTLAVSIYNQNSTKMKHLYKHFKLCKAKIKLLELTLCLHQSLQVLGAVSSEDFRIMLNTVRVF